jgi:MFS-type transporter involved in bile tolerance (Atg22 family)
MPSSAIGPPPSALHRVRGERLAPVAFRALSDGARVRDFWLISGVYFVSGASTMGLIGTHLIPACVDHGLTGVTTVGAATGIFAVIGGTASGWLSDRFYNRVYTVQLIERCWRGPQRRIP